MFFMLYYSICSVFSQSGHVFFYTLEIKRIEKENSTSAYNKPEGSYFLLIPVRSEAEETLSPFFICFSGSEIQGTLHRLLISWLEVKPHNT